jgi:hypothetical protein
VNIDRRTIASALLNQNQPHLYVMIIISEAPITRCFHRSSKARVLKPSRPSERPRQTPSYYIERWRPDTKIYDALSSPQGGKAVGSFKGPNDINTEHVATYDKLGDSTEPNAIIS